MSLNLHLAGISFRITHDPGITLKVASRHQQFQQFGEQHTTIQDSLHIHYCHAITDPQSGPAKVYSGGQKPYHWKVFKYPEQMVVYLFYPDQQVPTLLSLNPRRTNQTILIQSPSVQAEVLRYPADLIILQILGHFFKIILLHACGFSIGNKGIVGLGSSGAGKSTLTRLAHDFGATIIQDDRLIIRELNDGWWMYPVPLQSADQQQKQEIHQILLLNHGSSNYLKSVHPDQKVDRFLPHIAHFPIIPESYFYQLYLSDELIRNTPLYDLYFVPNSSSLSYLAKHFTVPGSDQELAKTRSVGKTYHPRSEHVASNPPSNGSGCTTG